MFQFFKLHKIELYNSEITEEQFQKGVLNQKQATNEEAIVKVLLEELFDKVYAQKHIKYRLKGEPRDKMCIPDFICTKGDKIYVFDVKKSITNTNMEQLFLYKSLASFMSGKEVECYHIFYDTEGVSDQIIKQHKGLTYKMLQDGLY